MAGKGLITTKQRQAIFDGMDKMTQKAAKEVLKKIDDTSKVHAVVCWEVGKLINDIYESDSFDENQRKQELQKLGAYVECVGVTLSSLYNMRNVHVAWPTIKEFKAVIDQRMTNGNSLTFSHLVEIQKVATPARRESLLAKIVKHNWSANQTADELAAKRETANFRAGGGRKPGIPSKPPAMLQKSTKICNQLINFNAAVDMPMFKGLLELEPDCVDETLAGGVEELRDRLTKLLETIPAQIKKLDQVHKRFVSVLDKAEVDEEEEEEEEDDDDSEVEEESEELASAAAKRSSKPQDDDEEDEDEEEEEEEDEDEDEDEDEEDDDE